MRIDVVSDTICPWCYVGKRRLEAALAQRPDLSPEIVWHSFQLNPEMPDNGMDRRAYLEAKFGGPQGAKQVYDRIREVGAGVGIEFDFDAIRTTPNTIDSHRLVYWAYEAGVQNAVVELLFSRYFLHGANIGAVDVLLEVAEACGLDRGDIAERLAGDRDRDMILGAARQASEIGVTGVPCYIVNGRYAVSGAQEPAYFLEVLDLAEKEERAGADGSAPPADPPPA